MPTPRIFGVYEGHLFAYQCDAVSGYTGTVTTTVRTSISNPFGRDVFIVNRAFNATTASSGACTVDIGVAADADTIGDNLIDGQSTATAGVLQTAGNNGGLMRRWNSDQFINMNCASGTITGLVGHLELIVTYVQS